MCFILNIDKDVELLSLKSLNLGDGQFFFADFPAYILQAKT